MLVAIKKRKFLILLILILILGSYLRLTGVFPGYPPYHSDEGMSYSAAVSMIINQNFDPLRYDYPAVVPLVNLFFYKLFFIPIFWIKFYMVHVPDIIEGLIRIPLSEIDYKKFFQLEILGERELNALYWGRYTTAIFGVGIILLSYLNTNKLFNKSSGLLVALLVAVNYRQILNSHLGLPDIYNAFFLLLSFFMTLRLLEKPNSKNYFWASVFAGIAVATKYQFFSLIPLLIVHLMLTFQKKSWKDRVIFLFSKSALAVPVIVLIIFVLANPYHFIKIEETRGWLEYVAGKYRTGRMELDIFSFSYLYKIGLGKITSWLIIAGIIASIISAKKQTLLLLSIVLPFFFITSFYTGGGFYTRNFVTITPILLVFVGGLFFYLSKLNKRIKVIAITALLLVVTIATWENFENAIIVAREYSKSWNTNELQEWQNSNFKEGNKIAAHPSVLLPENTVRLPFDYPSVFSLAEFRELEADYAVANLDWTTNDFYGWMAQDTAGGLKYWNKPVEEMEKTYASMMIRELSGFAIANFINPWQAYESNFIVAKVPKYEVSNKEVFKKFDYSDNPIKLDPEVWISEPMDISSLKGIYIEGNIKRETENNERDGFLWVKFYKSEEDAKKDSNKIAVRLSGRIKEKNIWELHTISAEIPKSATIATIGYQAYNPSSAIFLMEELTIYSASVKTDLNAVKLQPVQIDNDVLYPNSHGGI